MNQEKINQFFQVAINKTKSGTLIWRRGLTYTDISYFDWSGLIVDTHRSFVSEYRAGMIVLLIDKDENLSCYLRPDVNQLYQQLGDNNDPLLLRLYNVVYSQFPSVDSFIDSFISDFEDSSGPE